MRFPSCPAYAFRRSLLLLAGLWAAAVAATPAGASDLRRSAIVKAVERASPSVVNIHGPKSVGGSDDSPGDGSQLVNGMGTGVVLDARGYIVTNYHVVQGVRQIEVTMADGQALFARLISFDPKTDLAIIKINPTKSLPVLPIGTSSDLMRGETVIAVGNAYGYENTVTEGIISALHRTVQVSEKQQYVDLIQTDASINPGNSGGPLLNIDGELVGINVAVRAGAQNIGFAIPVDRVLEVAGDLVSTQRLEATFHGVTAQAGRSVRDGIVVGRLDKDSPAAKSGLQSGDIITAVASRGVVRKLDFELALLGRKAGDEIEITARRDQQPVKLNLVLSRTPTTRSASVDERSWDALGMRLSEIPAAQFQGLSKSYRGGLLVGEVREGSVADKEGILTGDVLVGMHIWETVSLENLAYVLNRPDFGELQPLKFYVLRGNKTLFGYFTLRTDGVERK